MVHVDVERDLELLARWLPTIEGRALAVEHVPGKGPRDGRADAIDEHHHDLRWALRVRTRLALLRTVPGGRQHAEILEYAYLRGGPEWRRRLCPRSPEDGLAEAVGLFFALLEMRERWATYRERSLRHSLAREHGRRLLGAAVAAYGAIVTGE